MRAVDPAPAAAQLERAQLSGPDGTFSALRAPGPDGAPRLVFCHATGFNAETYRRVLEPLTMRCEVLAIDQRGHGRTRAPADPRALSSFDQFADDLIFLLECEARGPSVLAGHSLGAVVSLLAAARRPDLTAGLVMFEPVLTPRALRLLARTPVWRALREAMPIRRSALRRRAAWPSRADAYSSYAAKPFFAGWAEGVLDDYLTGGLIEDDAGVRLACAPAWEGATFAAMAHDLWGAAKRLRRPAVMVRAERGSTAPANLATRFQRLQPGMRVAYVAGAGHLLPLERPAYCADELAQALGAFTAPADAGSN